VTTDDAISGDQATRAYLDRVRREIDDEVRRRRAAGDFPPSFERRLDELFARFTPTGESDDHFTEALKLADRSAYFDIAVPYGSRRAPKGLLKWSLWQAEAWFVKYVVTQINHFAASVMRVLHLLDERVSDLERDVGLLTPPALPEDELLVPGADPAPFFSAVTAKLSEPTAPSGRVLHVECGDGSLLGALTAAGLDAYGVDPGTAASDRAAQAGLDVRRDDALGHLGSVGDEALAGLVLSACVDRLSLAQRRRLLRLAEAKLAPGGTLVVIASTADAWERAVGPVAADLSAGRPLHRDTWVHLVGQAGFAGVDVTSAADGFAVVAVKPRVENAPVASGHEGAAAPNGALR
jgi:SAM-dependent methyltransferase